MMRHLTPGPRETKHGCFVVIDNSNVWIEGKRVSARLQGLKVDMDNRWRLNAESLVNHVLEGRDAARLALFGSIPPPVDSVWEKFAEVLEIHLSKRCTWSKKEKEVDMKIGMMLTTDATRLDERQHHEHRSYVIVGGDRDYCPVVQQILDYGMPICIWSWRHALNHAYLGLEQSYPPERFRIMYLDEIIHKIGFIDTTYHLDRFRLNRACTIVILNAAYHADKIDELVTERYCHLQSWMYLGDGRLLWVLDPRTDSAVVDAVFAKARELLPPEDVVSLVDLMAGTFARAAASAQYSEYSGYAALADVGVGGGGVLPSEPALAGAAAAADPASPAAAAAEDGEEQLAQEGAGEPRAWQPVCDAEAVRRQRALFDKDARRGTTPCTHREFCKYGLRCDYGHSEAERTLFKSSGQGQSPFTERNYRLRQVVCAKHASGDGAPGCTYLHPDQPRACLGCLGFFPFDGHCTRCQPEVRFERATLRPGEAAKGHFRLRTGVCEAHGSVMCARCLFGAAAA
jgi:hypothetical protein